MKHNLNETTNRGSKLSSIVNHSGTTFETLLDSSYEECVCGILQNNCKKITDREQKLIEDLQ